MPRLKYLSEADVLMLARLAYMSAGLVGGLSEAARLISKRPLSSSSSSSTAAASSGSSRRREVMPLVGSGPIRWPDVNLGTFFLSNTGLEFTSCNYEYFFSFLQCCGAGPHRTALALAPELPILVVAAAPTISINLKS